MIISEVLSSKFDNVSVGKLDINYIYENLSEILKKYFSKTFEGTNFRMKIAWKDILNSPNEKLHKMIIGEALLHHYMEIVLSKPFFGKGYLINPASEIPKSFDAFGKNGNKAIFGESKYVSNKSSNVGSLKTDYNKFLERLETGESLKIMARTLDYEDIDNPFNDESEQQIILFGIHSNPDNEIEYVEDRIEAIDLFDNDSVYKWIVISNDQFEDLVLEARRWANE